MLEIITIIIAIIIITIENLKIQKLEEKLEIKTSQNLSLKRVLAENDLIPWKYVK